MKNQKLCHVIYNLIKFSLLVHFWIRIRNLRIKSREPYSRPRRPSNIFVARFLCILDRKSGANFMTPVVTDREF